MDDFLHIAITSPAAVDNEPARIVQLLENGYHFLHLRKPDWSEEQMVRLIDEIPTGLRHRLVLHDFHHLAVPMKVGAVHVNARNPVIPQSLPYSASCHSLQELDSYPEARYKFLSPVFDSISKPGYKAAFDTAQLAPAITGKRVVALGGVTPSAFPMLEKAGFIGGAVLGDLWK